MSVWGYFEGTFRFDYAQSTLPICHERKVRLDIVLAENPKPSSSLPYAVLEYLSILPCMYIFVLIYLVLRNKCMLFFLLAILYCSCLFLYLCVVKLW